MRKTFKFTTYIKIITFILLIGYCFSLLGCNKKSKSINEKKTIAVSIVPQETFVKAVSGDEFNIVTMIPPGKSVENYSPSPQELEAFSISDIYFSIGVPAEKGNILAKATEFNSKIKIIDMAKEVGKIYADRLFVEHGDESKHEEMDNNEKTDNHIDEYSDEYFDEHLDEDKIQDGTEADNHEHTGRDPHIWLSPKRVIVMINIIKKELSLLNPDNKDIYEANAEKYIKELQALDSEIKNSLSGLKNKTFIVYHPAFGYFADDYGLHMVSLEKEGKEATVRDLQTAIDLAKSNGVKVIFYQAEIDSKQSKTFADEIGGKAVMLEPLSPDYINNLKKMTQAFIQTAHP